MQKEGDLILFCCPFALAYILSVLAEREGALWSFPEVIKALFLYTDRLYKVRLHTVGSRWFSITPWHLFDAGGVFITRQSETLDAINV